MHRIISIEIAYYKLSLRDTNLTLYQESSNKAYFDPIRLFCLVNKEDFTMDEIPDINITTNQLVTFSFLRDDLKDIELVAEVGDIIKFDERYFEVDNVSMNQYWAGRNPDTLPITTEGRVDRGFGYNIGIQVKAHMTRVSQLNLVSMRTGNNTIKTKNNLPRNL